MNRIRSVEVIVGLCAALAASSAAADRSSFVGRWHWNRVRSTPPPGGPVPDDFTSEISRCDSRVQWSVTVVTAEGQHVESYDAAATGEFGPISSNTAASCRLVGDALQTTFKGPAGQSDVQTCAVSADQKQMTCTGVLTDRDGRTINYVDVYDRM
jgi:hypothetical protein